MVDGVGGCSAADPPQRPPAEPQRGWPTACPAVVPYCGRPSSPARVTQHAPLIAQRRRRSGGTACRRQSAHRATSLALYAPPAKWRGAAARCAANACHGVQPHALGGHILPVMDDRGVPLRGTPRPRNGNFYSCAGPPAAWQRHPAQAIRAAGPLRWPGTLSRWQGEAQGLRAPSAYRAGPPPRLRALPAPPGAGLRLRASAAPRAARCAALEGRSKVAAPCGRAATPPAVARRQRRVKGSPLCGPRAALDTALPPRSVAPKVLGVKKPPVGWWGFLPPRPAPQPPARHVAPRRGLGLA